MSEEHEHNEVEIDLPGGVSTIFRGPIVITVTLIIALAGLGGWMIHQEAGAAHKAHEKILQTVEQATKNQEAIVKLLEKQTELSKIQAELLAKPVEERERFLEIYRHSDTWKGKKK